MILTPVLEPGSERPTAQAAPPSWGAEPAREDILRLWRAFAPLDMGLRARVLREGEVRSTSPNTAFTADGEVCVVLQGCLIQHIADSPMCAGVAGPGDFVDLSGGAEGRWITPGEIYQIGLSAFFAQTGEEGMRFLFSGAERRRIATEARLACAMAHQATARVASLLAEMCDACGAPNIPLCQSELADLLSLRRTSVNAACQVLRKAGAIRTVRGRTIVLNRDRLMEARCCTRPTESAVRALRSISLHQDTHAFVPGVATA